jgi:hypothetical protein
MGILGLLICLSGCASKEGYTGSGAGSPEETPGTKKPVRIYTDPVYTGHSGELNEIGNTINDYVSAHPDTFSGGYFSADSSKIFIGVAEPGDKAAAAKNWQTDLILGVNAWSQLTPSGLGPSSTHSKTPWQRSISKSPKEESIPSD